METGLLAVARAAEPDTPCSMFFPDGRRVTAAAVAGCVCVDDVSCTECERILGGRFVAIDVTARKKQRTYPPAPMSRVAAGLARIEGFGAPISGMADPVLAKGFEAAISGMAARLGLPAAVAERAKEVFRKMEEARAWPHGPGRSKFRSNVPLVYAACLSIACRIEGSARSLGELALAAAADGRVASRKEIARLVAHIRSRLEEAGQVTGIGMVSVSSYLRRFGALIRLGEAEEAAALEAARRLEEGAIDVPHNPGSVAAAVVSMALERAGARKPAQDVAAATGVSNKSIYLVCKKLRPHAELLFGEEGGDRQDDCAYQEAATGVSNKSIYLVCKKLRPHAELLFGEEGGDRQDDCTHQEAARGRGGRAGDGIGMVSVSSYIRRFDALVGLGEAESTAALEAARRLEEGVLGVRHNAASAAAAIVCLALKRAGARKPCVKDVAAAIGLHRVTIYRVCRTLGPHADLLFG